MAIQQADKLLKKHKDLHCAKVGDDRNVFWLCFFYNYGCRVNAQNVMLYRDKIIIVQGKVCYPSHLLQTVSVAIGD